MSVEVKLIGGPAGEHRADGFDDRAGHPTHGRGRHQGPRPTFAGSSTDSNMAMSLGIPAVTIGGGEGRNWHSRNEWYKSVNAWYGPQNACWPS